MRIRQTMAAASIMISHDRNMIGETGMKRKEKRGCVKYWGITLCTNYQP